MGSLRFKKDYLLILLILITSGIIYFPHLLSENLLKNTIIRYSISLDLFLWLISIKIHLILLLIIWYYSCKHWWRIVILIPLVIELYKFIGFIDSDKEVFDEVDYITSSPVTIPIIIAVGFLVNRIIKYKKYQELNYEIDTELRETLSYFGESRDFNLLEARYKNLKIHRIKYSKKEYLKELILLRNEFYQEE